MCPSHSRVFPAVQAVSEADHPSTHAIQASDWPGSYSVAEIVQGFTWIELRQKKGRTLEDAFERTFHTIQIAPSEIEDLVYPWSYTESLDDQPSPFSVAKAQWEALSSSKRREILLSSAYYTQRWRDLSHL